MCLSTVQISNASQKAHEAAKTWGETATPVGTVPRMPATTTDSATGIKTSDFRAEVRKAAAAAAIGGGSTAAAWAAGTTHTESWILPNPIRVEQDLYSHFFLLYIL